MSEEYIVHYFDIRGRAEPIRLILSYAGAKWKDQRFSYDNPPVIPAEIKAGKCDGVYKVIFVACIVKYEKTKMKIHCWYIYKPQRFLC